MQLIRALTVAWLVVLLVQPASGLFVNLTTPFSWKNTSPANLSFHALPNATACTLWTNETTWSAKLNLTGPFGANTSLLYTLPVGVWMWNVQCSNENETAFASANATIGVDTFAPAAVNLSVVEYNVSWTASSDAHSGVRRYELYRNNSIILNTSNANTSHFLDYNATPNASYAYRLDSVDGAENRNSTTAGFTPLSGLSSVSIVQVAPRTFNVSWTTLQAANETVRINTTNGSTATYNNSLFSTAHSILATSPTFNALSINVTSCLRQCITYTANTFAPPTVNTTLQFYNATYNNQTVLISVRLDSRFGLAQIDLYTNNSGSTAALYSSKLPGTLFHEVNLTFVTNETAREIRFYTTARDSVDETVQSPDYILLFNPNLAMPVPNATPTLNASALYVGQYLNLSFSLRLKLTDLSTVPTGPEQTLSAFFEILDEDNKTINQFTMQENGYFSNTWLDINTYKAFSGIDKNRYIQLNITAHPPLISTPTPTPTPEMQNVTATPEPKNATPAVQQASYSGRFLSADIAQTDSSAGTLTGYFIYDKTRATTFNATYAHSGDPAALFMLVKIKDAQNKTVKTVRSETKRAVTGKIILFSTPNVVLSAGQYLAEALIVSEEKQTVVDSRTIPLDVQRRGPEAATYLFAAAFLLAAAASVFVLKINHHKKGLLQ